LDFGKGLLQPILASDLQTRSHGLPNPLGRDRLRGTDKKDALFRATRRPCGTSHLFQHTPHAIPD
jgi:hypothetical protein